MLLEVTLNLNNNSISQKEYNALEGYYILNGVNYKKEDLIRKIVYSGQPGIYRFYQTVEKDLTICLNAFYFLIDSKIEQLQKFKKELKTFLKSD